MATAWLVVVMQIAVTLCTGRGWQALTAPLMTPRMACLVAAAHVLCTFQHSIGVCVVP